MFNGFLFPEISFLTRTRVISRIDNVCSFVILVCSRHLDKEGSMHISLTPELETKVRQKVASGFYNNASEVIRDALRFWEKNEELVQHMKLAMLRERLSIGAGQAKQGEFVEKSVSEIVSEARNA